MSYQFHNFFSSAETMEILVELWSSWAATAQFCMTLHTCYGLSDKNLIFCLDTVIDSFIFYHLYEKIYLFIFEGSREDHS